MDGYTGPTSGRITIGADGDFIKETFSDPPLTRDEQQAVAWFTAMSPNEQLREVRRLKWNSEEYLRGWEAWRAVAKEQETELSVLRRKLASFTPEGYTLPKAAESVIGHATTHGWRTARFWSPLEDGHGYRLKTAVKSGSWGFRLSWICTSAGTGSLDRSGLARSPGRDWHDAPSLVRIKEIIAENTRVSTD